MLYIGYKELKLYVDDSNKEGRREERGRTPCELLLSKSI